MDKNDNNEEKEDFEKLQKLGFELNPPVDRFSDQPDSGSSIGGIRGEQEYGILGGIASEEVENAPPEDDEAAGDLVFETEEVPKSAPLESIGGVSEYTAEHAMAEEEEAGKARKREGP